MEKWYIHQICSEKVYQKLFFILLFFNLMIKYFYINFWFFLIYFKERYKIKKCILHNSVKNSIITLVAVAHPFSCVLALVGEGHHTNYSSLLEKQDETNSIFFSILFISAAKNQMIIIFKSSLRILRALSMDYIKFEVISSNWTSSLRILRSLSMDYIKSIYL